MQTLMNKGLITTEKYREIYLTKEGKQLAESTWKKHKTIKNFLIDILGVDEKTADQDACAIEHVISQKSIKAMDNYLETE